MFQPRFVPRITDGTKRTTIRGKARCKPGDVLSLRQWTGLPYRSKQREILSTACTAVCAILIDADHIRVDNAYRITEQAQLDGYAQRDGFADWNEMVDWFTATHGLPFSGELIQW